MAGQHEVSFGEMLRSLRTQAGLTQEELAARAGLSLRTISDLERGVNETARRDTARLLADALELSGAARLEFLSAARGQQQDPSASPKVARAHEHLVAVTTPQLPRDLRHFTGRESDLTQLMEAVTADGGVVGIYSIDGMAGVGKSAFAVHAAHMLAPQFPDGQAFLSLRAHAAGQRPVEPEDALASLLLAAGVSAEHVPTDLQERSAMWRAHLSRKKMLLLLDDAVGHEQVRPLLPGESRSLVLITSRRHLSALDDVTSICLDTFLPDDAVEMLIRVADRADLDAADPAAGEVAQLCGLLPLALGMMARQLHHHPAWTLTSLADDLAAARDRLKLMHAENLSVEAAFDLSYQDLTSRQQRLFRRLGLNPGTDVAAHAVAALDDTTPAVARRGLDELFDQHLVTELASGRYRMHDLIRERASALAAKDDPQDSERALGRLLDYYVRAAMTADRHFGRAVKRVGVPWTGSPQSGSARVIDRLFDVDIRSARPSPRLNDYDTARAWLDTECANLLACADYAAEHRDDARLIRLAGALSSYISHAGLWDQALDIHAAACEAAERSGDRLGQASSLANLGWVKYLTGDSAGADLVLNEARRLYKAMGEALDEADVLVNIGNVRWLTGDFGSATEVLEEALQLYRDNGDRLGRADALRILGRVQRETALYDAAINSLAQALSIYREFSDVRRQADAMTDLGGAKRLTGSFAEAKELLKAACTLYQAIGDRRGEAIALVQNGAVFELTGEYDEALELSEKALAIIRQIGGGAYGEGDTLLRVGVILRRMGKFERAFQITMEGLTIFTGIGSLIGQADALNYLGAWHYAKGDHAQAGDALQKALELYTSVDNQHGEAETLNQLGVLQLEVADIDAARVSHSRALEASRAVGVPIEEARSLEGLGLCLLRLGEKTAGLAQLEESLRIYQKIGAAEAASALAEHIQRAMSD